MLDFAVLLALLVLSVRAFVALHRQSNILTEFEQPKLLLVLVLIYPLAPFILLLGPYFLSRVLLLVIVGLFFGFSWFIASKQSRALECAGTDRVKSTLVATNTATLGAIVGIIYVCFASIFVYISYEFSSRPLGS